MHTVKFRFGSPESRVETYERGQWDAFNFNTEAEVIAFCDGVEAASGWLDYVQWSDEDPAGDAQDDDVYEGSE